MAHQETLTTEVGVPITGSASPKKIDTNFDDSRQQQQECRRGRAETTQLSPHDSNSSRNDDDRRSGRRRLIQYVAFVSVFWFTVLFLTYEHENGLVYALLTLLSLAIMYMLGSICCVLMTTPGILSSQQRYEMTHTTGSMGNRTLHHAQDDEELEEVNDITLCRFEDTPHRIQACQEVVVPGLAPKDGTYTVVYVGIVFGRQLRSQGYLHLQFMPFKNKANNYNERSKQSSLAQSTINNGWKISGNSTFGSTSTTIKEGFVNAEGQIYWIVPSCSSVASSQPISSSGVLYRGVLDLQRCTLDDGEFQSISLSTAPSKDASTVSPPTVDGRHEGRIVRMEFIGSKEGSASTVDSGVGNNRRTREIV